MTDISVFRQHVTAQDTGRITLGDPLANPLQTDDSHRFRSSGLRMARNDTEMSENVAVRTTFLAAIQSHYGDRAMNMVKNQLIGETNVGRELRVSTVHDILAHLDKNATIDVTLPTHPPRTIEVPYSSLPTAVRNLADPATHLAQKIANGQQILQQVNQGNYVGAPSLTDVSDVCWYMHAMAEDKNGASFSQGALTIPDPNGHIHAFFEASADKYPRKTSHIGDIQAMQINNVVDSCLHRGIDIKGTNAPLQEFLPHEKTHMFYGAIPQDGPNTPSSMPTRMFFMKMEEHGYYDPTFNQTHNTIVARGPLPGDAETRRGHGGNFVGTALRHITGEQPVGSRKERVDNTMTKPYGELQKAAPKNPPEIRQMLNQNSPTGYSGGIRVMLANVQAVLDGEGPGTYQLSQTFRQRLTDFQQTMNQRFDQNTIGMRIGNEVILTHAELNI